MKKLILTLAVLASLAGVVMAATYSSGYSKNLQGCNPYIEKYKVILSNMQKITCATFNGYSLMIASFYQMLRKLFFEHY